ELRRSFAVRLRLLRQRAGPRIHSGILLHHHARQYLPVFVVIPNLPGIFRLVIVTRWKFPFWPPFTRADSTRLTNASLFTSSGRSISCQPWKTAAGKRKRG